MLRGGKFRISCQIQIPKLDMIFHDLKLFKTHRHPLCRHAHFFRHLLDSFGVRVLLCAERFLQSLDLKHTIILPCHTWHYIHTCTLYNMYTLNSVCNEANKKSLFTAIRPTLFFHPYLNTFYWKIL